MNQHPGPIRTLLVDDEPPALAKLRAFASARGDLEVIGEASDGALAIRRIQELRPELVFLDIQMPEATGFDVLAALADGTLPEVIFVTAFDAHAVRAFEVGAVDYLLKPLDPDRFTLAVDRAVSRLRASRPLETDARLRALLEAVSGGERIDRFLVKDGERSRFVAARQVEYLEADGNYVRLHSAGASFPVRATLQDVEARLDPRRFVRIHRGVIVNLDFVRHLEPWSHGDQRVVMASGDRLTLSRRYRDRLPGTFA